MPPACCARTAQSDPPAGSPDRRRGQHRAVRRTDRRPHRVRASGVRVPLRPVGRARRRPVGGQVQGQPGRPQRAAAAPRHLVHLTAAGIPPLPFHATAHVDGRRSRRSGSPDRPAQPSQRVAPAAAPTAGDKSCAFSAPLEAPRLAPGRRLHAPLVELRRPRLENSPDGRLLTILTPPRRRSRHTVRTADPPVRHSHQ